MAVKRRSQREVRVRFSKGDIKLLLCVVIFAASVALKYADFDAARTLRTQAAAMLRGGRDTGEVIAAMGEMIGNEGILAVFGAQGTQEPWALPIKAVPKDVTDVQAPEEIQPVYAESGYTEDLEDRETTLFPKLADETAYVMAFAHTQPVEGTLTSDYGGRTHPITGEQSFHFGLDIAAPKGTPLLSIGAGTVRETGNGSYGNYIIIDHADGFSTLYAHCDKLLAKKNENVEMGQEIAQVGATGNATGNHLHFEVWRDGKALDPQNYVTY